MPSKKALLRRIDRLEEAIRLTQEYTGLPARSGWDWYDALSSSHNPHMQIWVGQQPVEGFFQ